MSEFGPKQGIETIPSSAVRRDMLVSTDEFKEYPGVFVQVCWVPPFSQVERHRHTGMRELIQNLDLENPLDLVLQETSDAPEEVITLATNDHFIIPANRLHIIRNGAREEVKILAMGLKTEDGGKTVQE